MGNNQPTAPYDLRKIGGWGFLLASSVWLALYLLSPPCFPGADVFIFKDAGINLASGLGFVTRLNPGNPGVELSFYASYTPLFPFIYGLFVKIFGVGPKVNKVFDFLITAGAAVMFWFALQPRFCQKDTLVPSIFLLLVLLVALPVGPICSEPERPEALSFILTIASWKFIQYRIDTRNVFCATFLLGINGIVSPFGFILNGMGLLFLYVMQYVQQEDRPLRSPLKFLMIGTIGAVLPILTGGIWIYWHDSLAIQRFLDHVTGKSIGGHGAFGYFGALLAGDVNFYLYPFRNYGLYHIPRLIYLTITTIIALGYLYNTKNMRPSFHNYVFLIVISVMAIFTISVFAYETCYMGLSSAILIVLLSQLVARDYGYLPKMYLWLVFLCVFFISLFEFQYVAKDIVVAWQSAPSYYRMEQILKRLHPSQDQKLLNVATAPANYILFKSCGYVNVVDIKCLRNRSDRDWVDLLALSFIGSGDPMKPGYPPWGWNPAGLTLLYRPVLPQQTKFLGFVSSDSNTWEVELYKR
jgi:hypothetical protein